MYHSLQVLPSPRPDAKTISNLNEGKKGCTVNLIIEHLRLQIVLRVCVDVGASRKRDCLGHALFTFVYKEAGSWIQSRTTSPPSENRELGVSTWSIFLWHAISRSRESDTFSTDLGGAADTVISSTLTLSSPTNE